MTTPRPHAELAARQSVADELRLAARNAALAGINGWGNLCSDAADTIDTLRAQLAEAQKDAGRLDYIQKNARCDPQMDGNHVWWPTSLNKTLRGPTIRAAIDAAKGRA